MFRNVPTIQVMNMYEFFRGNPVLPLSEDAIDLEINTCSSHMLQAISHSTQFYFLTLLVLRVSLSAMCDDYVQFQVDKTLWLTGHKGKEEWNGNLYSLSLNVVRV